MKRKDYHKSEPGTLFRPIKNKPSKHSAWNNPINALWAFLATLWIAMELARWMGIV